MCIRVLICSTKFAPHTKVEQIRTRVLICTQVHFHKTPFIWPKNTQVQIYTPGVYLHRGVYCAYKRGFNRYGGQSRSILIFYMFLFIFLTLSQCKFAPLIQYTCLWPQGADTLIFFIHRLGSSIYRSSSPSPPPPPPKKKILGISSTKKYLKF